MVPFQTIVADPPWPYKTPGAFKTGNTGASAEARYDLMEMADLEALPVERVAADNAHLYLWTTNGFMEQAYTLARAWGFRPITILTWVKLTKDDKVSLGGTGYYYRNCTEHMLFCVRGSLRTDQSENRPTAFLWGRTPHSAKPEESYRLIESASPGPYLEMFSRKRRIGWRCLGNELDGQDIRASLRLLTLSNSAVA